MGERDFVLDGRPVRLLSGALHYFRVHEAQWGHRLAMLRAMGLNCVETYVPWNLHEPRPGEFQDVGGAGPVPGRGAGGGAVGDRPAGAVHLRRVGERRAAALADRAAGARGCGPGTRRICGPWTRWFARLLPQVVAAGSVDRRRPR